MSVLGGGLTQRDHPGVASFIRSVLRGRAPGDWGSAGPTGAQAVVGGAGEQSGERKGGHAVGWALSRGRRLLSSSVQCFTTGVCHPHDHKKRSV